MAQYCSRAADAGQADNAQGTVKELAATGFLAHRFPLSPNLFRTEKILTSRRAWSAATIRPFESTARQIGVHLGSKFSGPIRAGSFPDGS
jgi:hypothetical protein